MLSSAVAESILCSSGVKNVILANWEIMWALVLGRSGSKNKGDKVCLLIEHHRGWADLELPGTYGGIGKTGQAVCPRVTLTCWKLSHGSARLLVR